MQGIKRVYCNCCGKEIKIENGLWKEEVLCVKKEWGFFSGKDGQIHQFLVCESCYDQWIEGFRIPVGKEEQTELL